MESSAEGVKLVTCGVSWQDSGEDSVMPLLLLAQAAHPTSHCCLQSQCPVRPLGSLPGGVLAQPLSGTVPGVSLGTHTVAHVQQGTWSQVRVLVRGQGRAGSCRAQRCPTPGGSPRALLPPQPAILARTQHGHCFLSF